MDDLKEQLTRLAARRRAASGFTFAISLAIALWSANAGMKALFEAMNVAYDEKEKRSFIKLTLVHGLHNGGDRRRDLFIGLVIVMPLAWTSWASAPARNG